MFLTEYSFIQTPFNDANRPVSINCKYYDINNFNFKQQKVDCDNTPS